MPIHLPSQSVRVLTPNGLSRKGIATNPVAKIHQYEREKQRWIELHPEATPELYQAAMTRLACEAGI